MANLTALLSSPCSSVLLDGDKFNRDLDALTTAVFVLGPEAGLDLIERRAGAGLIVTFKGKMVLSEKIKEMLKIWIRSE